MNFLSATTNFQVLPQHHCGHWVETRKKAVIKLRTIGGKYYELTESGPPCRLKVTSSLSVLRNAVKRMLEEELDQNVSGTVRKTIADFDLVWQGRIVTPLTFLDHRQLFYGSTLYIVYRNDDLCEAM